MPFTTLASVTTLLNRTSLSAEDTALVNLMIPMVDGTIRNYCGWDVLATDYVKSFSGNGGATLDLKAYPINTLTSLLIDAVDTTASVSINADEGELYFTSDSGLTFTSGTLNIVASFNAGYSVVPAELAYAAGWLVTLNVKRILDESVGVTKERFNDISVEYDKVDIPPMVKNILDRYRRIGIY